jgi:hypothetical protein
MRLPSENDVLITRKNKGIFEYIEKKMEMKKRSMAKINAIRAE